MEWFKEELRICREFAPPDTVSCQFYITAAKRQTQTNNVVNAQPPGSKPTSTALHDKVNDVFQSIASARLSTSSRRHSTSSHRTSALIRDEAHGDPEREKELRAEDADRLRPLPQAHLKPMRTPSQRDPPEKDAPHMPSPSPPPPQPTRHHKQRSANLSLEIPSAAAAPGPATVEATTTTTTQNGPGFDFGFPSTPTEFQKNLMRFAFMPAAVKSRKSGWSVEWGRPELAHMLRALAGEWTGRRACVFVCGPPSMRVDVSDSVAELQTKVLGTSQEMDEIYLHTENYAL
jgi:hypothetical protein